MQLKPLRAIFAIVLVGTAVRSPLLAADGAADAVPPLRAFLQELVDIKVSEAGLLTIETAVNAGQARANYQSFHQRFSTYGSRTFRYQGGSTSSSGGSGGSVSISLEAGGKSGNLAVDLVEPDGEESLQLNQIESGALLVLHVQKSRVMLYRQTAKGALLVITRGSSARAFHAKSFAVLLEESPDAVQEELLPTLERYVDDTPFTRKMEDAPPGKAIVALRGGDRVVGQLAVESVDLGTRYGTLQIPREELKRIIFPRLAPSASEDAPPPECQVVTRTFSPRGAITAAEFLVTTPYGKVRVPSRDILYIAVGPPEPGGEGAAKEEGAHPAGASPKEAAGQ